MMEEKLTETLLFKKLKRIFPDEGRLLDAIATMLGISATLTVYVDSLGFTRLPHDVLYSLSLSSSYMLNLTEEDPDKDCGYIKFPELGDLENEQHNEELRRKIVKVVEMLHEQIHKEKNGVD